MDQRTVDYYEQNAWAVVAGTEILDTATARQYSRKRFCAYLEAGASVLDLGCGSGRDSKYFAEMGYRVRAIDISPTMAVQATKICGFAVEVMDFAELESEGEFDGVWASASLIHCSREDLEVDVLPRINRAMKQGGVLYVYLKEGEGVKRDEKGRLLQFYRKQDLREVFRAWECLALWHSESMRGSGERWVNGFIRS